MALSTKIIFYFYEVQKTLCLALFFICLFCYANLVWKKRDQFIKSWNYPGPFNLPVIGGIYHFLCRREDLLDRFTKIQEKYPMGFKMWVFYKLGYSFHEPEHIRRILIKLLAKENIICKTLKDGEVEGILTAPPEIWRKHRKIIEPSFNQQVLKSFVDVFARKSLILNKILIENCGQELDIRDIFARCVFDVTCETALGVKSNTQTEDLNYAHEINRLLHFWNIKFSTAWYHVEILWKLFGYEREVLSCKTQLEHFYAEVQKEKKIINKKKLPASSDEKVTPKRLPFLDHIMQNGEMSEDQIRVETATLLIAATDTSSIALSFIFTVLGMFPDIQQKVFEEVTQIMGNDRSPEDKDLPQMLYTERVIKETLRLFPVGPIVLRDVPEDVDMGEFVIPKGANILFGLVFIHRNPKYWPDPLKFDPDRFLPEEIAKRHPCTYIPFSFGPRNCIGRIYAMMSLKVIIATVIRKFRIHSEYKRIEDIRLEVDFILAYPYVGKVSMIPRQ